MLLNKSKRVRKGTEYSFDNKFEDGANPFVLGNNSRGRHSIKASEKVEITNRARNEVQAPKTDYVENYGPKAIKLIGIQTLPKVDINEDDFYNNSISFNKS